MTLSCLTQGGFLHRRVSYTGGFLYKVASYTGTLNTQQNPGKPHGAMQSMRYLHKLSPPAVVTNTVLLRSWETPSDCASPASVGAIPAMYLVILSKSRHQKTCLQGFRPGKTQTGLRSHRN